MPTLKPGDASRSSVRSQPRHRHKRRPTPQRSSQPPASTPGSAGENRTDPLPCTASGLRRFRSLRRVCSGRILPRRYRGFASAIQGRLCHRRLRHDGPTLLSKPAMPVLRHHRVAGAPPPSMSPCSAATTNAAPTMTSRSHARSSSTPPESSKPQPDPSQPRVARAIVRQGLICLVCLIRK
jgi:hypothetical protein